MEIWRYMLYDIYDIYDINSALTNAVIEEEEEECK
jgi:hypothetical protein